MPAKSADRELSVHLRDYYGVTAPDNFKLNIISLRRHWWDVHNPYYKYAYEYALMLRKQLSPTEPLLVLSREPRFLPFLAKLSSMPGIQGFYESHYFYFDLAWREGKVSRGDHARSQLEQKYLRQISGIIAIASQQASLYKKALPEVPVLFAPLGVKELSKEENSENKEKVWFERRTLAYIGHLLPYKGVDDLVSYGSRLKAKNVKAHFFGGTAEDVERYKAHSRIYGADNLNWQPFLSPNEMFFQLSQLASIGVVALQDNFYDRNLTCPVKALDFLSLGIPVIASDLPCTRDVLGESGIYFKAGDLDSMFENIVHLLQDVNFYKEKCQKSRMTANELSWPARAKKIIAFACNIRKA